MADANDPAIEAVRAEVADLLTSGERIIAVALQNSIHAPLKRDVAIVTDRRVILYRPKLLGRMDMEDFLWQDVEEIRISTKLLGTTLTVIGRRRERDGSSHTVSTEVQGLDNRQAIRVYARAQEAEEQWREKNRIRKMEEERARAGGVQIHSGPAPPAAIEERLAKLRALHQQGLISTAEFEARKTQIISEI